MTNGKRNAVSKPIQSLMFTSKNPDDQAVLQKVNELAALIPGVKPKAALKNFLLRVLPSEIQRVRKSGGRLLAS